MPSKSTQKKRGKATSPSKKASTRTNIPIAVARGETHRRPSIRSSERGLDVMHSEYVTTITVDSDADNASNGFFVIPSFLGYGGLDVNPGFSQAFPWLSNMARNYERYRFDKLQYRFVAKQPTTATGFLVVMFDYDFMDAPPTTKSEFLMNLSSREASVYKDVTLEVDPRRLSEGAMNGGWRYVSNEVFSSSDETRETMAGFPVAAVDGLPAAVVYSWDVWCSYVVRLEVERPPVDSTSEYRVAPEDSEGGAGEFYLATVNDLDPTSTTVQYALSNVGDPKVTVAQAFGPGGPVLAPASQPGAATGGETVVPWGIFRVLKEALGKITINVNWNSGTSGSGADRPDPLAASNKFELWAWLKNGLKLDDYVVKIPRFSDSTSYGDTYQNAKIHTSPAWGDASRYTSGLSMSFLLEETVYTALRTANVALNQLVFGLVNVGSVAFTSLACTSVVYAFAALNPGYHRDVALAIPASARIRVDQVLHPRFLFRSAPRAIPFNRPPTEDDDEEEHEAAKSRNPRPSTQFVSHGSAYIPSGLKQGTRL